MRPQWKLFHLAHRLISHLKAGLFCSFSSPAQPPAPSWIFFFSFSFFYSPFFIITKLIFLWQPSYIRFRNALQGEREDQNTCRAPPGCSWIAHGCILIIGCQRKLLSNFIICKMNGGERQCWEGPGTERGGWVVFFCKGDLISNQSFSLLLFSEFAPSSLFACLFFLFKCTLFLKKYSGHLLHLRNQ